MIDSITKMINVFVCEDKGNIFPGSDIHLFECPVVGVADANDSIFKELKKEKIVGPFHCMPSDWLKRPVSVFSYFLPFTSEVCHSNIAGKQASVEWMFGRFYGEVLNDRIRRMLVEWFKIRGISAVAPALESGYVVEGYKSNWSERHVAFIAGLGTFGKNKGFITKKGMAGRLGSVVTSAKLEVTSRKYHHHMEYCLEYSNGCCEICFTRCPIGALSPKGKDIKLCSEDRKHRRGIPVRREYGFPFSPCGKCYVGVPCSRKKP